MLQLGALKEPRGDDDLAGPSIEPPLGVVDGDAAAQLQTIGPGRQGLFGSLVVAGPQFDDMATQETIFLDTCGVVAPGIRRWQNWW